MKTAITNILYRILFFISPTLIKHIEDTHPERHLFIQALIEFQEYTLNSMNPKKIWFELKHIFKKYGIKIGIFIALVELLDHFGLPLLFCYLKMYKTATIFTAFPVSEVVIYPLILFTVKKIRNKTT